MRAENVYFGKIGCNSTPDEPWMIQREPGHCYCWHTNFAHKHLNRNKGKLLIVGSPLFEAIEFASDGWDVTYVDVRKPPPVPFKTIQGDICTMELEPASFDAASSTCVLCHVGMGRYGDPIVEDADEKALANIHRALRFGSLAAITFGPIAGTNNPSRIGDCHRVYTLNTVHKMAKNAGFEILDEKILDTLATPITWVDSVPPFRPDIVNVLDQHTISVLLEKL